ncbi:MAG TPA: 30S ribosomal protein S8 [Verrucomicrobiales bacterium]|nr:30S ribosomal protein S8 [Verrucomicrobiales bacterium]
MSVVTDPIADFLSRLKTASRARKDSFVAPYSRLKAELARILQEEGYIWSYEISTEEQFPQIVVKTKFVDTVPAVTDLKRVSKPGRRRFVGVDEIPRVLGGLGISILSTSRGVMTGHQARKEQVGGELLALVW